MTMAWNSNMLKVFVLSWISCLDESMSYWTNIYLCPGVVFVPRTPWFLGNEWYSICCAMNDIKFVEGKCSGVTQRG